MKPLTQIRDELAEIEIQSTVLKVVLSMVSTLPPTSCFRGLLNG